MDLLLVVACALVDDKDRVLIAQRPTGKHLAGLWEFPGGKIKLGETPEAALVRELDEELGIEVSSEYLTPVSFASFSYENFHLLMPLFICRRWQGMPRAREHKSLKWVKPHAMQSYKMPPADEPLVALLCDLL